MTETLRVGIFNTNTLYWEDRKYTTDGSVVNLYQGWAEHFAGIDLCSPTVHDGQQGKVDVPADLNVVELRQWWNPWTLRSVELPVLLFDVWSTFRDYHRTWDFVVVPTTDVFGQTVYAVASAFDVPVLVYLRGRVENETVSGHAGIQRLVADVWVRYLDWAVDAVVRDNAILTAGDELKREYEELAGSIESIVPSLIDAEEIVDPGSRTYPGPNEALRLLYLGRLVEYKRVDDLLDALTELECCSRRYELEVVGEGPYRESLERRAQSLGVEDRVTFVGHVDHDEVYDAYDRADVYVLPSRTEGSPKTIPEAMARGCPILATAVGNVPTLLDGDAGLVYEPGDVACLTAALRRLGTDEERWLTLSNAGIERARTFTTESQVAAIRRLLAEMYPGLG